MLAPVIPFVADAQENETYVVVQSPDLSGSYPIEIPINKNLNGSFVYHYGSMDDLSDGAVQLEVTYVNGLLEGDIKIYTNDGKIYCEGQYSANKKSGTWTYYTSKGAVKETGKYDPKADSSFMKTDHMIEPFLTPSYFEYGIDTSTVEEMRSARIIPLLNVGYNKEEGRKGIWKIYNEEGKLIEKRSY